MNHLIQLHGTPAEMGARMGAILKQGGFQPPQAPAHQRRFAQRCEQALREHAPAQHAELEALAQALELTGESRADLFALTLTAPFAEMVPACSVVAVLPERSATGQMLVGRNYDFFYAVSENFMTFQTRPAEGYASVGSSDIWVGRADGLNEHGLFVALSATFLPGLQAGLAFWFIVRQALEHCRTADEALDLLMALPHAQSRNYLLADRGGTALVAEAAVDGVEVRYPEDGVLAMTNHTLCYGGRDLFLPPDSPTRYARLRALAGLDRPVEPQDLAAALNDRPSGLRAHGELNGMSFGTIWSLYGSLDGPALHLAEGRPEGEWVYNPVSL